MKFNLAKQVSLALVTLGFATSSIAADISHSLRNNTEFNSAPENYFEIGLAAIAGKGSSFTRDDEDFSDFEVLVNGSYNWRGFFIDLYGESHTPLVFGYNAYDSKNWSFDVVLIPTGNGMGEELDDRFIGINERHVSVMLGGRATGYFAGNTLQLSMQHDITGNSSGTSASVLVGRNWQYRNWNFHGMLGLNYNDEKLVDYYLGVSEEEAARTDFTAFTGKSVLGFTAEAGVTYPINEDWVFRATTRYGSAIDNDSDSPLFLTDRDNAMSVSTSISYVF
ncbi:MipA/OmpV family protein [Paraglaciecola aquimarina]|uniref:MipA/OmpV family protein n=1 Tax=Paraglaciecola algarum TaxID=3050085 RepID=A0ABS9D889_9ALTE|nr:MipA/OmpV family protein [Paraglaciecola sp. G1-23]MCF2949139.1 MipA/OmpV family protein [Paraglaciecola sp. G1-23]